MMTPREACLQRLAVEDVVRKLGIEIKGREGAWLVACCPFHEDRRPSFRVASEVTSSAGRDHEKGFFLCHAGCASGSLFDLVIKLGRADSFKAALEFCGSNGAGPTGRRASANGAANGHREANGVAAQGPEARVATPVAPVVTEEEVEAAARALGEQPEALAYLREERGLSDKIIKDLRLGFVTKPTPAIVIPKPAQHPQHFKILPFPRPTKDSNILRFFHTKGANTKVLYPMDDFGQHGSATYVMVMESELDAALCIDLGVACVAVGGDKANHERLEPLFQRGYTPILCLDTDEAGKAGLGKAELELRRLGLTYGVVIHDLPMGCKDIGDVFRTKGREATKKWLEIAMESAVTKAPTETSQANPEVLKLLRTYTGEHGEVKIKKMLRNLDLMLENDPMFKGKLWLNEMGKVRMIGDEPMVDDEASNIRVYLEETYGIDWGKDNMFDRLRAICAKNAVHPVRNYLNALSWDGTKRIDSLVGDVLSLDKDQDIELKKLYLRKWLIGAVARVYEPGCKMDTMLVLFSKKEGVGKSMFASMLGGEWFSDESLRPDDRDCKIGLHKQWIVEVSEIDATTRKRDLAELRAFISRREDLLRTPYGRSEEVYKRGFVFIGTTNDKGVVKEDDGRRYWPVEVLEIDVAAVASMRDQIWAEAVTIYKSGEKWWLDDTGEAQRRADSQARFTDEDAALESIRNWVESESWSKTMGISMDDAMSHWKQHGIGVSRKEAAHVLRKCGLQNVRLWFPPGAPREAQRNLWRWV